MSKYSKIIKSTMIYFIGNVLSKLIVFFLLPIYTKYIPADDMGVYDTSVTIITLFSSMLFLDIGSCILKFKLEDKKDNGETALSNGSMVFIMSSVVYFLALATGSFLINTPYYGWIVLYGFLYAFNSAIGACARAVNKNTDYAFAGVLQTLLLAVTNIVLIIFYRVDYSSLFISFCFSTGVATLYLVLRCKLYDFVRIRYMAKEKFGEMLRFSLPLCVNSIAFWLLSSSSRVVVNYMLGSEATGYLSIANKFNSVIYLASSCVQLTWQEEAYAHDNADKDTGLFYSKAFILYYKVVMSCVIILIPVIKVGLYLFPFFIDKEYNASLAMIPSALIGTGLAIVSLFVGTIFGSLKKTNIVFTSTLLGAIVAVVSNIVLIKRGIGPVAANYSLILGYICSISMRVLILKSYIDFRCRFNDICVLILMVLCTVYIYAEIGVLWNFIWGIGLAIIIGWFFNKELAMVIKQIRGKIKNGK